MKINDIIEIFNSIIEEERRNKNLPIKGHFASYTSLSRQYANCKKCKVEISYFNNTLYPFIIEEITEAIPSNLEEEFIESVQMSAIKSFVKKFLEEKDKIINNDTGTK